MKNIHRKLFFLFLVSLLLTACAGNEEEQLPSGSDEGSVSQTNKTENPLSPSNLPPPNVEAAFFQRKEAWDSFSPSLKQKVLESYSKPSNQKGDTYETLFGKVVIEEKAEVKILEDGKISAQNVEEKGELVSTTLAITGEGTGSCSTGTPFLCISSPQDGQGVVVDVLRVDGAIKMSHQEGERRVDDAAFFGPLDPVAMVSVFKQITNAPLQRVGDFPILPSDLVPVMYRAPRAEGATEDPPAIEVGPFEKAVPLAGSGVYHVLVSAWKNTETGAVREDKRFIIYRQGIPLFAVNGVKLYPAHRSGNLRCDKEHPITLSSTPVNVTTSDICIETELQEAGTPNVGVVVENYSRNNGELVLNYSGSGEVAVETNPTTHKPIISTLVPLNVGLNHFKVKVQNTLLPGTAPEAALKEFELMNTRPQYSLKFTNASVQDGKVIEARSETENVSIQFCISSNGNTCVADWPEASKPKIFLNGIEIEAAQIRRDTSGQYSASVRPMVGANTFVVQTPSGNGFSVPEYKAAFGFGKVNKLYERGQLKEQNNFLKRGLSLEINKNIFSVDLKRILETYLNTNTFKASIKNAISQDPSPEIQCHEFDNQPIEASGGTALTFTNDPTIGSIEVNQMEPTAQHALVVQLTINNFSAQANLFTTIPVDINIRKLVVKLGVKFQKGSDQVNKLDIFALERDASGRDKVLDIVGSDGFNGFIRIAVERQPAARFFQRYEALLASNFYNSISKTVLCGVEDNLNNPQTGLAHWLSDLPKLVNYNIENPFRAPLQFELLGKQIGMDFAYDVLHAQELSFSERGLKIVNVPLRITPGPSILAGVPEALRNTLLGSLSAPDRNPEAPATSPETNENHNLSLKFSEEAINQALFAANFAGVLDIDVDPNFFSNNGIPFIKQVTPTPQDLVFSADDKRFFDLNQNGVKDDSSLPVLLRLRTEKTLAPYIHFLSQEEINQMAENIRRKNNAENTPADQLISLNTSLKYFQFVLPNLEIAVHRVQPISAEMGGYQTLCAIKSGHEQKTEQPDVEVPPVIRRGSEADSGFETACKQKIAVDYVTTLNGSCDENYEVFSTPARNGALISAVPGGSAIPLFKYKASIIVYGALQGMYREQRLQDKWTIQERPHQAAVLTAVENPPYTNFLRMRFLTKEPYTPQLLMKVIENHTSLPSEVLAQGNKIGNILVEALVHDCDRFNEVRIPIPDKFVDDPEVRGDFMEDLREFGITSLDLGDEVAELPLLNPDGSGLYLDFAVHLGIGYPFFISPEVTTNLVIQEVLRRQNNSN